MWYLTWAQHGKVHTSRGASTKLKGYPSGPPPSENHGSPLHRGSFRSPSFSSWGFFGLFGAFPFPYLAELIRRSRTGSSVTPCDPSEAHKVCGLRSTFSHELKSLCMSRFFLSFFFIPSSANTIVDQGILVQLGHLVQRFSL